MELRLSPPDQAGDCVGLLQGESLCLRLSVERGQVQCREERTHGLVPILSPASPVSDLSVFQSFLKECRFSYQLGRGLRLIVRGRGGGCGASRSRPNFVDLSQKSRVDTAQQTHPPSASDAETQRDLEVSVPPPSITIETQTVPPATSTTIQVEMSTLSLTTAYQLTSILPTPRGLQLDVHVQTQMDAYIQPQEAPKAAVLTEDSQEIFNYSLKKDRSSEENQERAFQIVVEVLSLAQQGRVVGMALAELEDLPMVTIISPLPIAMKLLEALHQESLWTHSANYMVRAAIARLARKFCMDYLFLSGLVLFENTSADIKQTLTEVTELAKQKDTIWPESGVLSQLSLINSLVVSPSHIAKWQQSLSVSTPSVFDVYTSKSPLPVLPLASHVYSKVSSFVGKKHFAESQLLVDAMYVGLREKSEGLGAALVDLFKATKGWKGIYSLLVCLEWGLHRNLVTPDLVQPLQPHLTVLSKPSSAPSLGIKSRMWRISEKLASVLLLLSANDSWARLLLAEMQSQLQESRVQRVLSYFGSMQVVVEPPIKLTTNITVEPDLVGRETELKATSQTLAEQKQVFIVGEAGVGKTVLADSLAAQLKVFPVVWRCEGDSAATFMGSIRSLSDALDLGEFDISRLINKLGSTKALLIINNVNEIKQEELPAFKELSAVTHIIATSRNENQPHPLPLKGLEPSTALSFVAQHSQRPGEQADMEELCGSLSCNPLGLKSAGTLLKASPAETVKSLLTSLQESPEQVEMGGVHFNGRLVEVLKRCIMEAKAPGIKQFLLIAALLSSEGVPEALFTSIFNALERRVGIEEAQQVALTYCLVTRSEEGLIGMQRLVQQLVLTIYPEFGEVQHMAEKKVYMLLETNDWSEANRQVYLSAECLIVRILPTVGTPLPEAVRLCVSVAYFQLNVLGMSKYTQPLVTKCASWMEHSEDWNACNTLGLCQWQLGWVKLAENWGLQARKLAEAKSDTQPKSMISIYNNLIMYYKKQGSMDAANEVLEKVKELQQASGDVSEYTLLNEASLAMAQGKLETALELYQKALALMGKRLGEHPDVASVQASIAIVYQKLNKLNEAEEWLQRALSIDEKYLNPRHPSLAWRYLQLSGVYRDRGNLTAAEEWMQRALAIVEDVLRDTHPDTAYVYDHLSYIYKAKDEMSQAKDYCEKAVLIREKLPELKLDLATSYSSLAYIYQDEKDFRQAKLFCEKAINIRLSFPGLETGLATSYNTLSQIYRADNNLAQAKIWGEKAISISESLPELKSTLASAYYNMSLVYDAGSCPIEAKSFCKKAIKIGESLPESKADLALYYLHLSQMLKSEKSLTEAREYSEKAISIGELLPEPTSTLAIAYHTLAQIYTENNLSEAKVFCQKAINVAEQLQGLKVSLAIYYNSLSQLYRTDKQMTEAKQFCEKAIDIAEQFPSDKANLAIYYNNLAQMYKDEKSFAGAKQFCQKAINIRDNVPELKADLASSYYLLAQIYQIQETKENLAAAKEYCERCIGIREEHLGPSHKDLDYPYYTLSLIYKALQNPKEAIKWQLRSIRIEESIEGYSQLNLAISYWNLSLLYKQEGDIANAEAFCMKCIRIREKELGPMHKDLDSPYNTLYSIYYELQDRPKATQYLLQSISINESIEGHDPLDLAISYWNLSLLYKKENDLPAAREAANKCVVKYEQAPEAQSQDLANAYENLYWIYQAEGNMAAAKELCLKCIGVREKVPELRYPGLSNSYYTLYECYKADNNLDEAVRCIQLSISIQEEPANPDYKDLGSTYSYLAWLYDKQNNKEAAKEAWEKSYAAQAKAAST